MKHQFLTLTSCFQGIFLNGVESVFGVSHREPSIPETYRLIRWIKRQGGDNIASVGIFEDRSGKCVILKHLQHRWNNLAYRQMLNEVGLLELFADWSYAARSGRMVSFPVLREMKDLPGELIVVKEFEEGKVLEIESSETQIAVITDCLEALRSLISGNQVPIGERTAWQIWLSFPYYWFRAFLKIPKRTKLMIALWSTFYRHWSGTIERTGVVTHRDLHSKNILVDGQKVFILDLENMVLCTRETELALVACLKHRHWGDALVHQMLATELGSEAAKRSFAALSIYYAVQMIVMDRVGGSYYKESLDYLIQYEGRLALLDL